MQALEQNTQWVCESRRKAPSPEAVTRSGSEDFLFEIASDTLTKDCGQAIALLEHAGLTEWIPVVYPPSGVSVAKLATEHNQHSSNTEGYLLISPNPANDHIFVEYFVANFDNEKEQYLSFIDMAGKKLFDVPVSEAFGLLSIDIKEFPAGTYIVNLNPLSTKFVKQ